MSPQTDASFQGLLRLKIRNAKPVLLILQQHACFKKYSRLIFHPHFNSKRALKARIRREENRRTFDSQFSLISELFLPTNSSHLVFIFSNLNSRGRQLNDKRNSNFRQVDGVSRWEVQSKRGRYGSRQNLPFST